MSVPNESDDDEWEETGAEWAVPAGVATSLFGDFTGPVDEYVSPTSFAECFFTITPLNSCPPFGNEDMLRWIYLVVEAAVFISTVTLSCRSAVADPTLMCLVWRSDVAWFCELLSHHPTCFFPLFICLPSQSVSKTQATFNIPVCAITTFFSFLLVSIRTMTHNR